MGCPRLDDAVPKAGLGGHQENKEPALVCSEHGEMEERHVTGKEAFTVSLLCVGIACVLQTGPPHS